MTGSRFLKTAISVNAISTTIMAARIKNFFRFFWFGIFLGKFEDV
jgi:hypothetical protein